MDINTIAKEIKSEAKKPITPIQHKAYEAIMAFKPITSYDVKRLKEAVRLYNSAVTISESGERSNDGIYGDVKELFSHRPSSTITRVRKHGTNDSYIIIDDKPYKLEVKTNGGECDDFLSWPINQIRATYIHFDLNIDVYKSKANPNGIRKLDVVMPLEHWLNRMKEANAIKPMPSRSNTHRKVMNVRSDNAKMYKAFCKDLENMVIMPFDRRMTYCSDDF